MELLISFLTVQRSLRLQTIVLPVMPSLQSELHVTRPLDDASIKKLPRLTPRRKTVPRQNPLPTQETPPLPPPPSEPYSLDFAEPSRRILSPHDHDVFVASPTYSLILSFVFTLSESAADRKNSSIASTALDPLIQNLLGILDEVEQLIEQYPPDGQGQSRFGNPAFRSFVDAVARSSDSWHRTLGITSPSCIGEVSTYLQHSFGNRARIDYGSGHELNFIMWLLCLNRLSLLPPPTFPAVTLLLVPRYIKLLRRLQSTYYLEPAGSHGVWGLDDYHFLPFLFGASQLLHHPYIRPLAIHNELVLEEEGDEYLYLDMVRFTMRSKTVKGLKWTQPMLDDISGAKNWEKVEQGMRRMFVKEVLGKLPVMQHFLFGTLIPAAEGMQKEGDAGVAKESEEKVGGELEIGAHGAKHVHRDDAWGDCCGIKIPSTVAASQEEKRKGEQQFRMVPFD